MAAALELILGPDPMLETGMAVVDPATFTVKLVNEPWLGTGVS